MWKKISIQLILLLLALSSIFFAYKIYFNNEKNLEKEKVHLNKLSDGNLKKSKNNEKKQTEVIDDSLKEETNLIKNLKYVSKDDMGNEYIIGSKFSKINEKDTDIINMIKVSAKIVMLNSEPIFINSDFAKYNNKNYETIFFGNVLITHLDNKITCENFNISIENNLAHVSEDVIFENSKGKLIADTIEIDLITKNSKIFMNDKNKKVIALNK